MLVPFTSRWGLKDGKPPGHPHLIFCSDKCYEKALAPYIVPEVLMRDPYYKTLRQADLLNANVDFVSVYTDDLRWKEHRAADPNYPSAGFSKWYETVRGYNINLALKEFSRRWLAMKEEQEIEDRQKQSEFQELIKYRPVPDHVRYHTAIIAKTRWGKTQLLQTQILLQLLRPDPPSMVILDSTGQMVGLIEQLAVFERLKDRLLVIDPADAPPLNMFNLSNPRIGTYSADQREAVQTEITSLFNYIFQSREYDLTGQMGLLFACAVRIILNRPNSTIVDLRNLLEEPFIRPDDWQKSAFAQDVERMDQETQHFFKKVFFNANLKGTRESIVNRLYSLTMESPAFQRMFTAQDNILDFYAATQEQRKIILVNTSEALLKDKGSPLFGRFIIARLMASIFERGHIPRDKRTPTELYVDEAAPYFDDTFDKLLTRVAQYGLKTTICFQHFHQLEEKLKASVAGQTNVKYLGALDYGDIRMMANECRCEPSFLQGLQKDLSDPPQWAEFAVFADSYTSHPMKLRLNFYTAEKQKKRTVNRRTYQSAPPPPTAPVSQNTLAASTKRQTKF